jgi:hypothetical protein
MVYPFGGRKYKLGCRVVGLVGVGDGVVGVVGRRGGGVVASLGTNSIDCRFLCQHNLCFFCICEHRGYLSFRCIVRSCGGQRYKLGGHHDVVCVGGGVGGVVYLGGERGGVVSLDTNSIDCRFLNRHSLCFSCICEHHEY